MPKITELFVYPIISCAGVHVDEVAIVPTGFEFDRNWMLIDNGGIFVTQREHPRLALVPVLSTYRYDDAAKGVKFGAYAAISGGVGSHLRVDSDLDVDWNF